MFYNNKLWDELVHGFLTLEYKQLPLGLQNLYYITNVYVNTSAKGSFQLVPMVPY
jgi:hypothetical protein